MFLITGVPFKRIKNLFLGKVQEMKIGFLQPEVPYKWIPYKRTLLYPLFIESDNC